MVMLASDLNNPDFLGAQNPDDLMHVEFLWKEPVDKWASENAGKEVRGKKTAFVRIMRAGDNTSIVETPVRNDHKARWPRKWLAWQMKEGLIEGAGVDVPGWRIEEWDVVSKNETQLHELKYMRFNTVEQIAGASDAQLQKIGIDGLGLRERAKVALKERNRAEYKSEMDAKDAEIKAMQDRLAKLEAMLPVSGKDTLHAPRK